MNLVPTENNLPQMSSIPFLLPSHQKHTLLETDGNYAIGKSCHHPPKTHQWVPNKVTRWSTHNRVHLSPSVTQKKSP